MTDAASTTDVVAYEEPESLPTLRRQVVEMVASMPQQLIIRTHEEAQHSTALVSKVAELRRKAEADRVAEKKYYLDGGRFIDNQYNELLEKLNGGEQVIKAGINAYDREQRRIAQEKVDQERREAEARAEAEAAVQRRIQEEQHRAEAAEALLTGETLPPPPEPVQAAPVVLPVPEPPRPKTITAGSSSANIRDKWVVDSVDIKALCQAVAEGTVTLEVVTANTSMLRQMLLSQPKDARETYSLPGVTFVNEGSVAVR